MVSLFEMHAMQATWRNKKFPEQELNNEWKLGRLGWKSWLVWEGYKTRIDVNNRIDFSTCGKESSKWKAGLKQSVNKLSDDGLFIVRDIAVMCAK